MCALRIRTGRPFPAGATVYRDGVNFSVFSRNGTAVTLELYKDAADDFPSQSIILDPVAHKTGDMWHIFIEELAAGAFYLYRVDGAFSPEKGHRFNENMHLIDPYAKELTPVAIFGNLPSDFKQVHDRMDILNGKISPAGNFPKCVVIDDRFDWQGDVPLNYPLQDCILYEMHTKGFTVDPSAKVQYAGTYRGIIEKIPYLKQLGITSLELLPVYEFDETETTQVNPRNGKRLSNYWGYSTVSFFSPKASYSSDKTPGGAVREFKEMVRALHQNGIEVILDVVFNHTAEGNEHGVTFSFRGFDNSIYYILDDHYKQYYKNYSGCGNTFNCNHPVVRTFIIDALRYWALIMHVDGFRFDLASILGRDRNGNLMENPPLLEEISEDPVLANTKIIAEAWDADSAYQVGSFPGGRWAEWNDRFRDDIRKFWCGADFMVDAAATRFAGSADIYRASGRKPFHSVNFVTCHDGFTLNDLVSYNGKHNDDNGENNRDGSNNNCSYNYGFEGVTENPAIEQVRIRQIKNLFLTLLLSQGTPMILGGDEFRRTQHGNNNAYCQDNDISWFDWSLIEKNNELFHFCKNAIHFRKKHPAFRRPEFFEGVDHSGNYVPDISWFDRTGASPSWKDLNKFFACHIDGSHAEILAQNDDNDFFIICNADDKDISVVLPPIIAEQSWYRCVDTSIPSPDDFVEAGEEELIGSQKVYVLPAQSMVVFIRKENTP